MPNPLHILKGWFRSYIYAPKKIQTLSEQRLEKCRVCPFAVEKTFLKILRAGAVEEKKKACQFCGCPTVEKSLVENENCPKGYWEK